MSNLPFFFFAAALTAACLATISIWAPKTLAVKVTALAISCVFFPIGYVAMADLLSKPKPIALEWWKRQADEATVLASTFEEGAGIYLWLQVAETDEPRSYVLPWDRQLAEELEKALQKAQEDKTGVKMRLPFERSWDDKEPKFYALPRPSMPSKDNEHSSPPQIYSAPSNDA